MGHNVSAIAGVKSANFYEQGNAINEIWVDDVELISRLPFGDSDLGQAGWPKGSWPKIPWHQFIIPLKRDLSQNITMSTQDGLSCYRIVYPKTGYLGMYHGLDTPVGEALAAPAFALAVMIWVLLFRSMLWDSFYEEVNELIPDEKRCLFQPHDPHYGLPIELRDGLTARTVITRWCLRKLFMLIAGVIWLVLAVPATMTTMIECENETVLLAPVSSFGKYMLWQAAWIGSMCVVGFVLNIFRFFWELRKMRREGSKNSPQP